MLAQRLQPQEWLAAGAAPTNGEKRVLDPCSRLDLALETRRPANCRIDEVCKTYDRPRRGLIGLFTLPYGCCSPAAHRQDGWGVSMQYWSCTGECAMYVPAAAAK